MTILLAISLVFGKGGEVSASTMMTPGFPPSFLKVSNKTCDSLGKWQSIWPVGLSQPISLVPKG